MISLSIFALALLLAVDFYLSRKFYENPFFFSAQIPECFSDEIQTLYDETEDGDNEFDLQLEKVDVANASGLDIQGIKIINYDAKQAEIWFIEE